MTALSARLAQTRDRTLIEAPEGALGLQDLSTTRPASASEPAAPAARAALSMRATAGFVRALLALDGVAETILLLAPTLPRGAGHRPDGRTGSTLLISDRTDLEGVTDLEAWALRQAPTAPWPSPRNGS